MCKEYSKIEYDIQRRRNVEYSQFGLLRDTSLDCEEGQLRYTSFLTCFIFLFLYLL